MKPAAIIAIILIIIAIAVLLWWIFSTVNTNPAAVTTPTSTPVITPTSTTGVTTPAFDQSLSDGTIVIHYPSANFALAATPQQILVSSYIPPCNGTFNYCLYYNNSSTYAGTNFESAGIRIEKRTDLTTQAKCLTTEPTNYTGLTPTTITTSTDYSVSEFGSLAAPLSDAAAGHFANDIIYRVALNSGCYEFETRVGQSDFGNYPSGSIQQFTTTDESALQNEMGAILDTLQLASSSEQIVLPQS